MAPQACRHRRPPLRPGSPPLPDRFPARQLASAASNAARKLADNDADLTTQDLNRLLRHAHLRQRFRLPDAPPVNHDRDEDDDDGEDELPLPAPKPLEPKYIHFANGRPMWVANRALLNELAFREGYTAPLKDWAKHPLATPSPNSDPTHPHKTSELGARGIVPTT